MGRKLLTLFTVFTMWFSAGIIPTYMNFNNLGLLDTRTAIIFGFAIETYNLIIMKSFFEQVPEALEEAAFIDGAGHFRVFWNIYLPLSKPALATVGLFYGISRWNGYFWAMQLLKDDNKIPLQVFLKKLIVERVSNPSDAAIVTKGILNITNYTGIRTDHSGNRSDDRGIPVHSEIIFQKQASPSAV